MLPSPIGRVGQPNYSVYRQKIVAGAVERALDSALAQVRRKDYASELRDAGAAPVHLLAAVFDGKRAWARAEREG